MKTPKQLTPKAKPKATPNSEAKIKKANKNMPAMPSPNKTPNSTNKIKKQQAGVDQKTPQPNGQTPFKKGPKTPKVKKSLASDENAKTPKILANNIQNKTASVKKQIQSPEGESKSIPKPQKRKQSVTGETEATPPKQAKTSVDSKDGKERKSRRKPRSAEKRAEVHQQRKEFQKKFVMKLKVGDPTVLENAAKFESKIAELQSRENLTKSGTRTLRRFKRYLKMINIIQGNSSGNSNLNKSALEHLKTMKKTKPKSQPDSKSPNIKKDQIGAFQKKQFKSEVFVKNLPYEIATEQITEHFEQVGKVVDVRVPPGKEKKGFAYVKFEDEETCQKALSLHHSDINGRKIIVLLKGVPNSPPKKK